MICNLPGLPPTPLATAGGLGFIGSGVIARLLAAGHTVHAVCRPCEAVAPATKAIIDELSGLPGSSDRLRWFSADLLQEGSFDEAIAGCK